MSLTAFDRTFRVRSSDGQSTYSVAFSSDGERLSIMCECRAGLFGQPCKHKDALIAGDASILVEPGQREVLEEVVQWIEKSSLAAVLREMRDAEQALELAQKRHKLAKKKFLDQIRPI